MSGKVHPPGTFCGVRIRDINIWKNPGTKEPGSSYRDRHFAPHRDPTAARAIGNVMRGEQASRRRMLMREIEAERERRRNMREKERDRNA